MGNAPTKLEPLQKLRTYPAFQHLRAKAETHALKFRPKESKRLQQLGQFERVLDERTQAAWNILVQCRKNGWISIKRRSSRRRSILLPSESEEQTEEP